VTGESRVDAGEGALIDESPSTLRRGAVDRIRRPHQRRWLVVAAVLAVLVASGTTTARLFVWPAQGMPSHVSAIVMLAGPGDRLDMALQLARARRAPILVVSQGYKGYGSVCPPKIPGVTLICFDPNPSSTRGEAQFVGRLAKRSHWSAVVLVTTRAQDTRARIRVGRCFSGKVYVVAVPQPWYDLPYALTYEWGATFKALVLQRAC
jgi:hypothetical protein